MYRSLTISLLFCLLLLPSPSTAQEAAADATDWTLLNTPGEAHKKLDIFVGQWTTTTKIWMAGPEEQPTVSQGESTYEWILDGRFVEERTSSVLKFPSADGAVTEVPYNGRGFIGYDNVRKVYVNTWVDSLSTTISTNKGNFSPDGKTLTLYGEMDEPAQGIYGRLIRLENKLESRDRHVFTLYDLHAGENYRVMEIVYERR